MSKLLRILVSALAGIAGAVVFMPGVADASVSANVNFLFPATEFSIGDTDINVQLSFTNDNDNNQATLTNTVCATGQSNPPCDDAGSGSPGDDKGINFIMSCGSPGLTVCGVGGADPGVFQADSVGTGSGACANRTFTISVSNPTFGTLRFVPDGAAPITVAPGATCTVSFQADVIGFPVFDQDPNTPGQQTGQIADVLMYSGSLDAYDTDSSNLTITRAQPTITTQASAATGLGGTITDTAFINGRAFPEAAANVRFQLFPPSDPTCQGQPVFTSDVTISATQNSVTSAPFTPTEVGRYEWIATYQGDANNDPVAGACGDANESVEVSKAQPTITTDAGDDITLGGELTDTATVAGRFEPTDSTVDFRLYGPDDPTCSGTPVFESLGIPLPPTVSTVTSAAFTPTVPGTHRWVATYAGDANNESAVGECGDPAETVRVLGTPTIATQASPGVTAGVGQVFDSATVTGRADPQAGATIDFRLYAPGDIDCSRAPVFESLGIDYPVAGGSVRSAAFTPTVAGTYRWVATYNGDANNRSAVGVCGDPTEMVEVTVNLNVELPATGSETNMLLTSGAAISLAGVALMMLGRRRRPLFWS